MRRLWLRIDSKLEHWLMAAFFSYFCIIILVEVVRRYVLGETSQWGEMTARYAFVYLVYIGVAEVAKSRDHIRIDVVPRLLGDRGRLALYVYFDFLYLVLAALVIYYSLQVVELSIKNKTVMTGFDLNVAFAQAALPLGWGLLAYRVVQRFVRTLQSYRAGNGVPLGGSGLSD